MTLGNHASSTGFKNVVVDKSKYIITSDEVSDLWKFRRDMGESNYFQGRNKKKNHQKKLHQISRDTK